MRRSLMMNRWRTQAIRRERIRLSKPRMQKIGVAFGHLIRESSQRESLIWN